MLGKGAEQAAEPPRDSLWPHPSPTQAVLPPSAAVPARERVLGSARALLGLVLPTSRRDASPRSADTTRTDLSMATAFSTQSLGNWISAQLPRFSLPALRKQTLRPGSMFCLCRLRGSGGRGRNDCERRSNFRLHCRLRPDLRRREGVSVWEAGLAGQGRG